MTVLQLIKSSLRLLGVISPYNDPKAEDTATALEALNLLLQEWHNKELVSLTEQQSFSVSSGTLYYVIGSGQTWDGNKPLKVLAAFLRDSSGYDYPLRIIGETEYMELYDKDVSTRPSVLFYQPSNTTGTVYLYGSPDAAYTIYLMSQAAFTSYTNSNLSDTMAYPDGYLSALKWNLAVEVSPEYGKDPSQLVLKRASDTLAAIKKTNLKIPKQMMLDPIFSKGGFFNINTRGME